MTGRVFSVIFCLLWAGTVSAQSFLHLKEAETGSALFGAHIKFSDPENKERYKFDISDNSGKVEIPFTGKVKISVTYLGYKSIDTLLTGGSHTLTLYPLKNILKPVELVSDFIPRGEDAVVQQITVINRERIENQGAQNLRDLLTNNLNIRIANDNILGSSLSMQGIGGENVKIMIDGVPVIGRLDGNIDLGQINLNNIERVEIIQGPASAAYGTNALGGIINLITKKDITTTVEAGVTGYYETVGNYNVDANASFRVKNHSLRFSGGRYFFDGFNSQPDSTRFMQWKPKLQAFGDVQYIWKIKEVSLRYLGSYFNEKIENKGRPLAPFGVSARDNYYITDRISNTLSFTGFLKPRHHLDVTANYSLFVRNVEVIFKDLVTLDKNLLEKNTDRFNLIMSRGIYSYTGASEKLLVQAGYDINVETGTGPRIKTGTQSMGDYAGFLSAEYTAWKRLTLKPSFRYGYNSSFRMPVIPAFALKIQAHKYLQLRAAYSRGFRAPDLKELYFEFIDVNHNIVGNENLNAETSHNVTASLTFKMNKKDYAFSIEPSGFYNDINNRITLVYTGDLSANGIPVYTNRNIGRFQSTGANVNLTFAYKGLQLNSGFSYTGIAQTFNNQNAQNAEFLFYPEVRTNVTYTYTRWNISGNLFYKYNGTQPFLFTDENEELIRGSIQGFHTLDVGVTKHFFKKALRITALGKNLLNVRNLLQNGIAPNGGAHSSSAGPVSAAWGRTFALAVSYNFSWTKKKNEKNQ